MPFDAVKTSLSPSDYKSEIPPVVSPLDSKDSLSEHIKKMSKNHGSLGLSASKYVSVRWHRKCIFPSQILVDSS